MYIASQNNKASPNVVKLALIKMIIQATIQEVFEYIFKPWHVKINCFIMLIITIWYTIHKF
jgi:hypothetical protein